MSSVWAEESLEITISNFTEITNSYTTKYTHNYSVGGNTFPIVAYGVFKNASGIQMNKGKDTYIKNTTAFPGYITKIVATWSATGKNSPTLYANTNSVASTSSTKLGVGSNSETTQTFTISNADTKNYKYFYFDGTTVTGACYLSSLKIYYETSSGAGTTTTIDASGITNTNKFVGTNAGSLSASVTYGTPAEAVPEATVTWSGDNDKVATINNTTGVVTLVGAGKVTFTASYAGVTDVYKSSSDTYEMTVTDEDPSLVTIWSEDFSGYSADDVPSGGKYSYACVDGNSSTKIYKDALAGGESPELLINKNNGSFSATIPLDNGYTGTLKLQFKNNNAINVSAKDNNGNYLLESTSVSANTTTGSSVNIAGVTAETISVTIEWSNGSSSSNVRLDDIVLRGKEVPAKPTLTITTNAGKWASFTPEWNCTLEDGAKAYIITGVNGSTLTGEEVAVLEAGKGYFIKGEVASHAYTATATDADATSTDRNLVVGCATNTNIDGEGNTKYILGTNASGAGLFYVDSSITIPAGKAYLDAGKVIDAPARALSLDFEEGETTSLREIRNEELGIKNAEFFNLNGQRVAQPTKGLYIVNGRKVVIK